MIIDFFIGVALLVFFPIWGPIAICIFLAYGLFWAFTEMGRDVRISFLRWCGKTL